MKSLIVTVVTLMTYLIPTHLYAQTSAKVAHEAKHLFIDVHDMEPGKVKFEDVAKAHAKDLSVQDKYDMQFLKYWVDEKRGKIYCLSTAADSATIAHTHQEAHGLLPSSVHMVTDGDEAQPILKSNLYLDVHEMGAGKVKAADVAAAHQKDLAVQKKYGVNLLNYWVDEKTGVIMCLAEAKNAASLVSTHKEAHGLLPVSVSKVLQGE
jgi:hypothetical protein